MHFWENLGRDFYLQVQGNMNHAIGVCFGTIGNGIRTNYQVHYPDGSVRTFRGSNHLAYFKDSRRFNPCNLSRIYSPEEISALAG